MRNIQFNTGRVYGTKQILNIMAPNPRDDADLIDWVSVSFNDEARNIIGTVSLMVCETMSNYDIGCAVLREYDAGRYNQIPHII